jgi:hypothetical protein
MSIVLRLNEKRLADGELAGEVEVVDDGQRVLIRTTDELMTFLRACLGTDMTGDQPRET